MRNGYLKCIRYELCHIKNTSGISHLNSNNEITSQIKLTQACCSNKCFYRSQTNTVDVDERDKEKQSREKIYYKEWTHYTEEWTHY